MPFPGGIEAMERNRPAPDRHNRDTLAVMSENHPTYKSVKKRLELRAKFNEKQLETQSSQDTVVPEITKPKTDAQKAAAKRKKEKQRANQKPKKAAEERGATTPPKFNESLIKAIQKK